MRRWIDKPVESDLSGEWKYGWLSIAEPIQPEVGTPSWCDPVKSDNLIASRSEMSGDGRVEERASPSLGEQEGDSARLTSQRST